MLTTFELDEYVFGALVAGASGFLLKGGELADLVHAIRVVAGGESLLAPSINATADPDLADYRQHAQPQADLRRRPHDLGAA